MARTTLRTAFQALAIGMATAAIMAAAPASAQKTKPAAIGVKPGILEAEAIAALDRMGGHLRGLKQFELVATGSTEQVYENGQKLQFLQRTTYLIGGPQMMRVTVETDNQKRNIFYDGKNLTILAPRAAKYIQLPATGNIGPLMARANEEWGLDFPVQDLFRWGDASATAVRPAEGFRVGASTINGHLTDHYAFRQKGVDWQIWIEQGANPLPRKMVITNTDDTAQPQYVAYFEWNTAPSIAAGTFDFKPGADDKRIDIKQFAAK